MSQLSVEEIAELRKDPTSFRDYLRHITGRTVEAEPAKPTLIAVPDPGYRVAHTGGWPLGSAATGPTPTGDTCTCAKCRSNPASTVVRQTQEGTAA
ncbi:hypothetical protein ACWCPF_26120 [Streptomyces sp. NPDC001858]